jgi:hypothetical protein
MKYHLRDAPDTVLRILWTVLLPETISLCKPTCRIVFRAITKPLDSIDPEDDQLSPVRKQFGEGEGGSRMAAIKGFWAAGVHQRQDLLRASSRDETWRQLIMSTTATDTILCI